MWPFAVSVCTAALHVQREEHGLTRARLAKQELRLQLEKQASGSQPHPHWSHRLRPLPAPPLRRTRRRPRASSLSIGRGWRCRLDLFAWQAALWLSGYETSAAGPGLPWPGFQWPCQVAVAARGWATRIRLGPDPESTAGPGLPAAGGRWPLRGSGPGCQLARWPASCCRSAVQNPPSADGTAAGPPAQVACPLGVWAHGASPCQAREKP
jgi:hypothetical protein